VRPIDGCDKDGSCSTLMRTERLRAAGPAETAEWVRWYNLEPVHVTRGVLG